MDRNVRSADIEVQLHFYHSCAPYLPATVPRNLKETLRLSLIGISFSLKSMHLHPFITHTYSVHKIWTPFSAAGHTKAARIREDAKWAHRVSEAKNRRADPESKEIWLGNKEAALEALRCKKMLERQLRKVEGTLTTAEYQLETLQSAVSNTVMYANMKYVARTLKAAQHHLPIDIDDIHDTVATIRGLVTWHLTILV